MRQTCLNMVYDLAKRDKRVLFVGSDLSPGLLADMKRDMPDRWYMEGITEQNLIGMSAGLAKEGYIPYANTIATFITRRCYEQVAVDLCLHDLPVRLIANGGGLVYAPAWAHASGDRGHRHHACAAEHDRDRGLRRQGNGAADERHA